MVWFEVWKAYLSAFCNKAGLETGNPVLVDPQPCSMIEMNDQIICSENTCIVIVIRSRYWRDRCCASSMRSETRDEWGHNKAGSQKSGSGVIEKRHLFRN